MRVSEFIDMIRIKLADTVEPYLWNDDLLLDFLNSTIEDIGRRTGLYDAAYYVLELVRNVNTYNLRGGGYSCYFYDKESNMRSKPLLYIPSSVISALIQNDTQRGEPKYYSNDLENKRFMVHPTPDKNYTLIMTLKNIPVFTLSDELDFPEIELCTLGVLYRAYSVSDVETYNFQAYTSNLQLYELKLNKFKSEFIRDTKVPEVAHMHRGLF